MVRLQSQLPMTILQLFVLMTGLYRLMLVKLGLLRLVPSAITIPHSLMGGVRTGVMKSSFTLGIQMKS